MIGRNSAALGAYGEISGQQRERGDRLHNSRSNKTGQCCLQSSTEFVKLRSKSML